MGSVLRALAGLAALSVAVILPPSPARGTAVAAPLQEAPLSGGVVDTFAGGGVGDGRTGPESHLRWPVKVEADAAGNIYWAERDGGYWDGFRSGSWNTGSHRIRMLDAATGTVHTVAGHGLLGSLALGRSWDGSVATRAPLWAGGFAVDSGGNIYVHDVQLATLRRVDAATGVITKITDAPFIEAAPVAVDAHDRVYFTRIVGNAPYKQYIMRYDPASGAIETIAGGGALDGDGRPATAVSINQPHDLALGEDGSVYFTEVGGVLNGNRVRRIDPSGVLTTLVGGPLGRSSGEGAYGFLTRVEAQAGGRMYHRLAVMPDGSVWYTDRPAYERSRIRRIGTEQELDGVAGSRRVTTVLESRGGFRDGALGQAQFSYLTDVTALPDGSYVVADLLNNRIRRVRDGQVSTVAGNGLRSDRLDPPSVYTWTGDGGRAAQAFVASPVAVAVAPDGTAYVGESGLQPVRALLRRVDVDGTISTVLGSRGVGYSGDGGPAHDAEVTTMWDLVVAPDGDVYVADLGARVVRKIEADTSSITTVAGTGAQGDTGDGGPATQATFKSLGSLALGPDGALYVADLTARRIRRVDPAGTIHAFAGTGELGFSGDGGPAHAATFRAPQGLAVMPNGSVLVSDASRIRQISPDGTITTIAGNGSYKAVEEQGVGWLETSFKYAGDIAVDPGTGMIFVADTFHQEIKRLDPDGTVTIVAGRAMTDVDEGEQTVYWGDLCGDGRPGRQACFHYPRNIALTPGGDLLVADQNNLRVRVLHDAVPAGA